MENTINNQEQVIRNPIDTQKLLHTYLAILDMNSTKHSFETIIKTLKEKFDFEVDKDDLFIYFEPTLEEFTTDLELQMKHLK